MDATLTKSLTMPRQAWGRWIGRAVFLLTAIMCLYVGVSLWSARGNLGQALKQLPLGVLPSVVGLVLLGIGLRWLRWTYYVRRLEWPVPWHHSLTVFVASFAFTATPGKAGELVKSVLLGERYGVRMADGIGVLLAERVTDLVGVVILAAGGLALLADARIYFVVTTLMVAAITFFVSCRWVYEPVLSQVGRLPKLSGISQKVLRLLETGQSLLKPGPFLVGVCIALFAWGCEAAALHVLLRGFGVQTHVLTSCSIFGVATLVGALSALPGGLGGFEVVMGLLLSRVGMAVSAAAMPVVVFRFCTLWLGSLLGLACMLGWLALTNKPQEAEEPVGDAA